MEGGSATETPLCSVYIPLIREPQRRVVALRVPRTSDAIFPHRKWIRTSKSNNLLSSHFRRKVLS